MTDLIVEGGCYVCLLNSFIIERFGIVSWLRATSFQFLSTVTKARRASSDGFSIFILSQNNECPHLLRSYVCLTFGFNFFARFASFFPFSYISQGGTQQSLRGGSTQKSDPLCFYIPFLT